MFNLSRRVGCAELPRAEAEKIHGDYLAFTDEIKEIRLASWKPRTSAHTDGDHGQGTKRKRHHHRRPLCRDQGATRRLLSHRGQRPQRRDSNCRKDPVSALWKYRGQTSLGVNRYRTTPMDTFLPPTETAQG